MTSNEYKTCQKVRNEIRKIDELKENNHVSFIPYEEDIEMENIINADNYVDPQNDTIITIDYQNKKSLKALFD